MQKRRPFVPAGPGRRSGLPDVAAVDITISSSCVVRFPARSCSRSCSRSATAFLALRFLVRTDSCSFITRWFKSLFSERHLESWTWSSWSFFAVFLAMLCDANKLAWWQRRRTERAQGFRSNPAFCQTCKDKRQFKPFHIKKSQFYNRNSSFLQQEHLISLKS